jgi:two-component system, chemotaxis family, sensor kinase Cph1
VSYRTSSNRSDDSRTRKIEQNVMQSGIDNVAEMIVANSDAPGQAGCEREAIHLPGSIQPHGALLALAPEDLQVIHAAGDTTPLFGVPAERLPGTSVATLLSADQIGKIRALLGPDRKLERPLHAFTLDPPDAAVVDVVVHQASGLLVLEFDPRREAAPDNSLALVQSMIRHVQRADGTQAFCQAVVDEVRAVTGFERVMVYRFGTDGSGEAIRSPISPSRPARCISATGSARFPTPATRRRRSSLRSIRGRVSRSTSARA